MPDSTTKRKRVTGEVIEIEDSDEGPAPKKVASTSSSTTKPKAAPKKLTKKEPEPSRWPWIDRCRPEMEFKGTKITMYNCGGTVFKATGKTIADRLDKLEKFLDECQGDETTHPSYGQY